MRYVQVAQISAVTLSPQPVISLERASPIRPGYLLAAPPGQVLALHLHVFPLTQWTCSLIIVNDNGNHFFSTCYVLNNFQHDSIAGNYFPNLTHEGLFFLKCSKIHKHTVYHLKHV